MGGLSGVGVHGLYEKSAFDEELLGVFEGAALHTMRVLLLKWPYFSWTHWSERHWMKPQACADRKLTEETDVFGGYFEIFNQTSILLCVGCTREEAAQCSQQHTACSKVPVSAFVLR